MSEFTKFTPDNFILYLRKSRADDPTESVEEVLSKHEARLQDFMQRRYGGKIPKENIYREVCSAESIADREKIKEVLLRIEDPNIAGVVVADVARLSRGDLGDCNEIITRFRYTKTLVVTDTMKFDLEDKRDRQYFQDELLRGAYYLDYVKEVLRRGREGAVQNRGCYIGTKPPYGYNKIKIGKNPSLEPNKDAGIVRLIFDWYVNEDLTFSQIAYKLSEMKIPSPKNGLWQKGSIRQTLANAHYDGKVYYGRSKETTFVENGELVTKKLRQKDYIIADGLHPAIVDHDIFVRAQEKLNRNPSYKKGCELKNPFAGILKCAKCGRSIRQHPYKKADARMECSNTTLCGKSIKVAVVEEAIINALEQSELPTLEAKLKNGEGNAHNIKKSLLDSFEKELQDLKAQEDRQYQFLESGTYSEEVFEKRHTILLEKMEDCKAKIRETQASMPKKIDYAEKIILLKKAIEGLKSNTTTPLEKNKLLKPIVERIDLETWDTGRWNDVGYSLNIELRL